MDAATGSKQVPLRQLDAAVQLQCGAEGPAARAAGRHDNHAGTATGNRQTAVQSLQTWWRDNVFCAAGSNL